MSLFFLEWHLLFFNILFHHYPICLINKYWPLQWSQLCPLLFPPVSLTFICSRSSKWRASREYTSTFLDHDSAGTWEGLNIDFQPIGPVFTSSPHVGFHRCLNPQFLGLVHFSSMNYLWLWWLPPYRHVGFWVLCSVKSIFTLSLDFLLLFYFFYCLCLLSFSVMCLWLCGL